MVGIAFGALLGFVASLLTWGVQWWTQRREDLKLSAQEQARVRLLLREENDHNVASLKAFWRTCTDSSSLDPGIGYGPDEIEFEHRLRLAQLPLPAWSTHFWETLGAAIPHALSETEIRETFALNAQLERFVQLRVKIQNKFNEPDWEKARTEYDQLRRVKRLNNGLLNASGQQLAQQVASRLQLLNEQTFADFHGESGRPGCEGIQAEARNPIGELSPLTRISTSTTTA